MCCRLDAYTEFWVIDPYCPLSALLRHYSVWLRKHFLVFQLFSDTMKLLSFPYLAFFRIIISMNPIEVFCLSFCSKKSRERIKQIHFHAYFAMISTRLVEPKSPSLRLGFSRSTRHITIPFQLAPRWARCEGRRFTGIIDGVKHYFRYVSMSQSDKNS